MPTRAPGPLQGLWYLNGGQSNTPVVVSRALGVGDGAGSQPGGYPVAAQQAAGCPCVTSGEGPWRSCSDP